jgi:hypothetical protein
MALCPFALYKPVPNHGGPISTILGVVIHVTAGEGDPYNEFANPANQVSSHFGILNGQGGTTDGAIEQYVDTSLTSWAEVAGNANYISVETEGEPTDPLTPAQVASFARLYQWIHSVHGVPYTITDTPGDVGFITHGDGGVAWGDHIDCPGPLRSAQRQTILNLASNQPPSPGEDTMAVSAAFTFKPNQIDYIQVTGGELKHTWILSGKPDTEVVSTPAGVQVTGTPGVSVIGGAAWVTVEDVNGGSHTCFQTSTGTTWNWVQ